MFSSPCTLPPFTAGFINGQTELRTSSGGVDYTNGTFYAPYGSSFMVLCEGGVGEKRWYVLGFGGIQVFLPNDSAQRVYQSSGELIVGNFGENEDERILCEDEQGSTVSTILAEGTYSSSVSLYYSFLNRMLHPTLSLVTSAFASPTVMAILFSSFPGVIITSASVTPTSITVFWALPPRGGSSDNRQASCCVVGLPNMCRNNNEVKISNGNFSVDGLEEFTSYSCLITSLSAGYMASTLGDSKHICITVCKQIATC